MIYKLSVENTVKVPVKFNLNNAGKVSSFNFSLICDRVSADEIKAAIEDKDFLVKDFLKRVTKNWHGQTLVVDEGNTPVEFNDDAFDVMLTVAGLENVALKSYLEATAAKEKN